MTSTPDPPHEHEDRLIGGIEAPAALVEQMRQGVRGWVRFGAYHVQMGTDGVRLSAHQMRRGAAQVGRTAPVVVLAGLSAAALAPVAVAAGGVVLGGMAGAGMGALAGLGTNILSEMIVRGTDRWREPTPAGASFGLEEAQRELSACIEQVLDADDERAAQLREEIAAVLDQIDAAEAAVLEAMEVGEQRIHTHLATVFAELGQTFTEFTFLLAGLEGAAVRIQQTLQRQDAEHRADRERSRRQSAELTLIRDQLAVIDKRMRSRRSKNATTSGNPSTTWVGACPYPGLVAFGEDDVEIFHGREQVSAQLAAVMAERLSGPSMLVVTGASGAGKSSLLRAGLLARLASGRLPGMPEAARWPRLVMTPTADPLTELAVHLAALAGIDAVTLTDTLAAAPERAPLVMRQAVAKYLEEHQRGARQAQQARLIVVVDQFEEIFTLAADSTRSPLSATGQHDAAAALGADARREAFVSVLHAAAHVPVGPDESSAALVVLGIRGDFWDRCAAYPQLLEALEAGPFTVRPMSEPELRRAITGPAHAAGLQLEAGLVDLVLGELRTHTPGLTRSGLQVGEGALPLLSQAMRAAWDNREDDRLTRHGYGSGGGIAHAVQTSAEAAYTALTPAQQGLAQQLMHRMTAVLPDGHYARRPLTRQELHTGHPPEQAHQIDLVVEAFTTRRLMVANGDSIELAHDVLLTAWPRLAGWLAGDHHEQALYSELIHDATEWTSKDRDPSFLYQGIRLETARTATRRWQADPARYPGLSLPGPADAFLDASKHAATRTRRRWQALFVVLATLLVIAIVTAQGAVRSGQEAERQRAVALSRNAQLLSRQIALHSQSLLPSDPMTSARLAAAAWAIAPTAEARGSMYALLSQPARAVLTNHTERVVSAAFSSDGTRLVTAGEDGTVWAWDPATGKQVGALLTGHTEQVVSAAFSSDGTRLVTAGVEGTVQVWDSITGKQVGAPLTGHTDYVLSVTFSPDGTRLATIGRDETVRVWDAATHQQVGAPFNYTAWVSSVAFSPDGARLVTAGDEAMRVWDIATHQQVGAPFSGHTGSVLSVAFSSDGTRLATAGGDGTVRVWSTATHQQVGASFTGHTGPVFSVTFSSDGTRLASTGRDQTVRVWDTATGKQVGASLTGHTAWASLVAFSLDGTRLATAGDERVRVWDTATHQQVGAPLTGHTRSILSAAFSLDGTRLATAGDDGTVRVWDTATRQQVDVLPTGHTGWVWRAAFSPDGTRLATAGEDTPVWVWDLATGKQVGAPLGGNHIGQVMSAAFSPDGTRLATVGENGAVQVEELATGKQVGASLIGHTGSVFSAAFSSDGTRLATAGGDGTVRVWDAATHQQVGAPLTGHTSLVLSVTFSLDGTRLVSSGADKTVRIWNVALPRDLLRAVCGIAERSFTAYEWQRYIPREPYRRSC